MRSNTGMAFWRVLLLLSLLTLVLTQALNNGADDAQPPPPAAVPETPEHPENDIHLRPPAQPHPDIIDVVAPEKPDDPALPPADGEAPPPDNDPVPPAEDAAPVPPPVDEQPPPAEELPTTEEQPPSPEDPPPTDGEPPPEDEQPQPPRGPHNPWRVPSPGQPAVEIKAGHSFNFSWTPNTEGTVNLELWQIEESTPVPKFLLACELPSASLKLALLQMYASY